MRSQLGFAPVNFPLEEAPAAGEYPPTTEEAQQLVKKNISSGQEDHSSTQEGEKLSEEEKSATPAPSQTPTAQTSEAPSETGSTDLTTPSPAITPQPVKAQPTPIPQTRSTRSVVPVIPAVPILPLSPKTSRQHHRDSVSVVSSTSNPQLESSSNETRRSSTTSILPNTGTSPGVSAETSKPASPPAPPKSWADLVRSKTVSKPTNNAASTSQLAKGLGPAKNETLSDVLNTIDVTATHTAAKLAFLKPRGLVNTGNMCYMNSVWINLFVATTYADCYRCCKFWFSVFHFTNFLRGLANGQLIVLKVILL